METVSDFIFWNSKITADGDAVMKLKDAYPLEERLWPTSTTLKSRDITFRTKVFLVKAMVSPVVMYGCASCTIKKAECRRIDDFELRC